jgi:hypothetical protein
MLNFIWPCIGLKAEKKGYHRIWEAKLQPLEANGPAFINILKSMFGDVLVTRGQTKSPKMLKVGLSFVTSDS